MPHLIPDNEIERLSSLRGVSLNEANRQIEQTFIEKLPNDISDPTWKLKQKLANAIDNARAAEVSLFDTFGEEVMFCFDQLVLVQRLARVIAHLTSLRQSDCFTPRIRKNFIKTSKSLLKTSLYTICSIFPHLSASVGSDLN
jgi:hypothetical protein